MPVGVSEKGLEMVMLDRSGDQSEQVNQIDAGQAEFDRRAEILGLTHLEKGIAETLNTLSYESRQKIFNAINIYKPVSIEESQAIAEATLKAYGLPVHKA